MCRAYCYNLFALTLIFNNTVLVVENQRGADTAAVVCCCSHIHEPIVVLESMIAVAREPHRFLERHTTYQGKSIVRRCFQKLHGSGLLQPTRTRYVYTVRVDYRSLDVGDKCPVGLP